MNPSVSGMLLAIGGVVLIAIGWGDRWDEFWDALRTGEFTPKPPEPIYVPAEGNVAAPAVQGQQLVMAPTGAWTTTQRRPA